MDPTQQAWAAGLFEGEGSITYRSGGYFQLQMSMTDFDVIRRFGQIVGIDKYYTKPKRKEHHKDQLVWYCKKKSEIIRILELFLPYFGDRRAHKALNFLDHWECN